MSRMNLWGRASLACLLAATGAASGPVADIAVAQETASLSTKAGDRQRAKEKERERQAAARSGMPQYTGRIVVKFKPSPTARGLNTDEKAVVASVAKTQGASVRDVRKLSLGGSVVEGVSPGKAVAVARALDKRADVEYAVADTRLQATGVNDPLFPKQWDLAPGDFGIDAPAAWSNSKGENTVVAVLDTGIRPHSEFSGRILPGADLISDLATANDGNGRDMDAADPGDWFDQGTCEDAEARKSSWHGTHVAGTLAAATDNATGVAGIAGKARIVPVRVLGVCGGSNLDIADGIAWAAGVPIAGLPSNANPAQVINLSLGGIHECSPYTQAAINSARSRGAVVVTAAGNDAIDASEFTPGNCNGVINVGASTEEGSDASFSNYGDSVSLVAPGTGILSTYNSGSRTPGSDSYASMQGTSMAAPHVAAVAALIKSTKPTITPDAVRKAIVGSARAVDPEWCYGCGAGLLDAGRALTAAGIVGKAPVVTESTPASATVNATTRVTLKGAELAGASRVTFGGAAAQIVTAAPTSLVVNAPARATAGTVPVVVTTPAGSTAPINFTYVAAPTLSRATPANGSPDGNTVVTLTGRSLTGATKVTFGSATGEIISVTDTSLTVRSPQKAQNDASTVEVRVSTPAGTSTAARFTYVVPVPAVSRLSARQGAPDGGNAVVLTGRNLESATEVSVGGESTVFSKNDDGTLTITSMPAMKPGVSSVDIVVKNRWTESRPIAYRYVVPVPSISRLSVRQGNPDGGNEVVLTGRNLDSVTKVLVGGQETEFTKRDDGSVVIPRIPAMRDGVANVPIVVHNLWTESRAQNYRYVVPNPTLQRMTPNQGSPLGGGRVVITGRALDMIEMLQWGDRRFARAGEGQTEPSDGTFVVNADNTEISLLVPAYEGALTTSAAVTVPVTVTNKWQVTSRVTNYRYVVPVPQIQRLSERTGSPAGDNQVVLTGRNLDTVESVTVEGNPVNYTVDRDAGEVRVWMPPMLGDVSTVAIVAKNRWAMSRPVSYRYVIPVPTITQMSVRSGSSLGGDSITVTGRSLDSVTEVWVGRARAQSVVTNDDGSLTFVTPAKDAQDADEVDVEVRNLWSQSRKGSATRFRYVTPSDGGSSLTDVVETVRGLMR